MGILTFRPHPGSGVCPSSCPWLRPPRTKTPMGTGNCVDESTVCGGGEAAKPNLLPLLHRIVGEAESTLGNWEGIDTYKPNCGGRRRSSFARLGSHVASIGSKILPRAKCARERQGTPTLSPPSPGPLTAQPSRWLVRRISGLGPERELVDGSDLSESTPWQPPGALTPELATLSAAEIGKLPNSGSSSRLRLTMAERIGILDRRILLRGRESAADCRYAFSTAHWNFVIGLPCQAGPQNLDVTPKRKFDHGVSVCPNPVLCRRREPGDEYCQIALIFVCTSTQSGHSVNQRYVPHDVLMLALVPVLRMIIPRLPALLRPRRQCLGDPFMRGI